MRREEIAQNRVFAATRGKLFDAQSSFDDLFEYRVKLALALSGLQGDAAIDVLANAFCEAVRSQREIKRQIRALHWKAKNHASVEESTEEVRLVAEAFSIELRKMLEEG